ncbi:DUF2721 domain-containing protein [Bacteroidota bacterium]
MDPSQNFIQFLQSCITPVVLISGVGLLLLTITNRLGRTIDRARHLVAELDNPNIKRYSKKQNEINILYKRSRFLRNSIGLIIPLLFFMNLFKIDLRTIGYFLFFFSIITILISCLYFFRDVILSLNALKLEAEEHI